MSIDIRQVNCLLSTDPETAIAHWEDDYRAQVQRISEEILHNRTRSPVVLLAGPSGSGKTTTGHRVRECIASMGVPAHLISMDDYYLGWDAPDFPTLPDGSRDLESPYCIDIPLLDSHFAALEAGEVVHVPLYDFPSHSRMPDRSIRMDPSQGDIFIFEGIHAHNSLFAEPHPNAYRLYVSPTQGFTCDGKPLCDPGILRLIRRTVRDYLFRGASVVYNLSLWENVLQGDRKYIQPYRPSASGEIGTTLPYELSALKAYGERLFHRLSEDVPCRGLVNQALEALQLAVPIPAGLIPPDSILREFVGN